MALALSLMSRDDFQVGFIALDKYANRYYRPRRMKPNTPTNFGKEGDAIAFRILPPSRLFLCSFRTVRF